MKEEIGGYLMIRIFISEYEDGTLSMECNHMHYAFDDRFNRDDVKKEDIYDRMREMSDSAVKEGWLPKFVLVWRNDA